MDSTAANTWRVLGTLIRIRFTDPAEMPCTADYLTAACNQVDTTSRPVIEKAEVHQALAELIKRGLVRVEETMGTFRYAELAASRYQLTPPEHALFGTLLLHPPLTTMALLKESYRLYPFRNETQILDTIAKLEESHSVALARHWPPTPEGDQRFTHAHYEPDPQSPSDSPANNRSGDELEERIAELERLIDAVAPPLDHER